MALKAGNIVIGGTVPVKNDDTEIGAPKEVVIVEKAIPQENNTVMIDGRPKKFNKISRYMLDMLTTED